MHQSLYRRAECLVHIEAGAGGLVSGSQTLREAPLLAGCEQDAGTLLGTEV